MNEVQARKKFQFRKDVEILALDDVVWFQEGPGVRKHQFVDNGIKLLNVANIEKNKINLDKSKNYISEKESEEKYPHFLAEEGDLVIASSGIKIENFDEKIAFINKEHLPLCMNTSTIRFKSHDENKLDIQYFKWFLRSECFKKQVQFWVTGSAQLNFGPSHLKKMFVSVPNIITQKSIVKILNTADRLRQKRKEQLTLLDNYLKSVFLDMFGDPVKNEKGWETENIRDISKRISDGPFGSNLKTEHYQNTGIRVIRLQNIGVGEFQDEDKAYISESHFETIKKHSCKAGDVLIATMGDPNIRACMFPEEISFAVNKADCIQLRPKSNVIMAEYICGFINSPSAIYLIAKFLHGQTRTRISMGQLSNLNIPVPPIKLQSKFVDIVKQVEQTKQTMRASLDEMDNHFNALMQRYFG